MTTFNGYPINSPIEFQKYFYLSGPGAAVQVETYRDGTVRKSLLTIGTRPPEASLPTQNTVNSV